MTSIRRVLASCLLVAACQREDAAEQKAETADAKEMPGMDMPGMPGMKAPAESLMVTFSAAKVRNGGVRWAPAEVASLSTTIEAPGRIVMNDDATARLGAPASGQVVTVHVRPGERVGRGAALVTLRSQDASAAQADLAKAQSEVSSRQAAAVYSRTARERAERLLALKAIPRQDMERAVADDELARASLEQAQAELARARASASQLGVGSAPGAMVIRSPLAGIVVSRDVAPGAVVEAGAPLVTVADPSSLWLTVSLTGALGSSVRTGDRVRFVVPTLPADTFSARVQSVGGAYDSTTRTLPIRAAITSVGKLRPEMFATVWIESGEPQSGVVVPDAAVQRYGDKTVVFVAHPAADGGARFERRQVELRPGVAGRSLVTAGLRAGEPIVVQGSFAVKSELEKAKMPKMEM